MFPGNEKVLQLTSTRDINWIEKKNVILQMRVRKKYEASLGLDERDIGMIWLI